MSDSDDDASFGLVMPFVSVQSKGGPFDDDAFTAGYEMGLLDARLASAGDWITSCQFDIRSQNRDQADLIAMRYGFVATVEDDTLGWMLITLSRQASA